MDLVQQVQVDQTVQTVQQVQVALQVQLVQSQLLLVLLDQWV
jgi:hypothetical protein